MKGSRRNTTLNYTLPDFTNNLKLNIFFIQLAKNNPEYFLDGIHIESVYGCFPSCILNGGRSFIRPQYSPMQIEQTFAILAEQEIVTRLTFTNMLAKPYHLEDTYVADILTCARKYPVEMIVYSDEVAAYLKKHYGFKCILSTTRSITDITIFNQALTNYSYIVLDYNKNKDFDFISQINNPEKVEIMVNEYCRPRCPSREAHYFQNSEDQMNGVMQPFFCDHNDDGAFFAHNPAHPVYFTNDEILQLNRTYGIHHFKIVGRGIPLETIIESYTYYLLKPQFRTFIKEVLSGRISL